MKDKKQPNKLDSKDAFDEMAWIKKAQDSFNNLPEFKDRVFTLSLDQLRTELRKFIEPGTEVIKDKNIINLDNYLNDLLPRYLTFHTTVSYIFLFDYYLTKSSVYVKVVREYNFNRSRIYKLITNSIFYKIFKRFTIIDELITKDISLVETISTINGIDMEVHRDHWSNEREKLSVSAGLQILGLSNTILYLDTLLEDFKDEKYKNAVSITRIFVEHITAKYRRLLVSINYDTTYLDSLLNTKGE